MFNCSRNRWTAAGLRLMILILVTLPLAPSSTDKVAAQTISLKQGLSPVDNPLKGLVPYAAPEKNRFPHSMEFSYLPLSKLVVGEKKYDFVALESLLNDIASRGNQTTFRIMLEYPGKTDLIPKYLVKQGLTVHKYKNTNTAPFPPTDVETPDYSDKNLRRCMQDFVMELGKRYDGDPRIGYITAGLLGTWGEWHTYPRDDLWASKEVQLEILNAYGKAFTKTPILLRYPAGKDSYHHAPTFDQPFGYHDDSFCYATAPTGKKDDDWFFWTSMKSAGLSDVWQKHPIGGEIRPETWGCCFDEESCAPKGQSFETCRDLTHVTWLMDTGMFQEKANQKRYDRAINQVRKMGYDFYVAEATLKTQKSVKDDEMTLNVSLKISNIGLAPFYHQGWPIHLAAIDPKTGKVLQQWKTDQSLLGILPATAQKENVELRFANSIPNQFKTAVFAIGVPNPMQGGKPLRFANQTQDQHSPGWLTLGSLQHD